jgi:hypothetical protein
MDRSFGTSWAAVIDELKTSALAARQKFAEAIRGDGATRSDAIA